MSVVEEHEPMPTPFRPGQSLDGIKNLMTSDYRFLVTKKSYLLSEAKLYCTTLSKWIRLGWWRRWWHGDLSEWVEHETFKSFLEDSGRRGVGLEWQRHGETFLALERAGVPGAKEILVEWLGMEKAAELGMGSHGAGHESKPRNSCGEFIGPQGGSTRGDIITSGSGPQQSGESSPVSGERGTSTAYTLRRFIRDIADEELPEERRDELSSLLDDIRSERLSVNQAAIRAGYRKQKSAPEKILALWDKCSEEEKHEILEQLQSRM